MTRVPRRWWRPAAFAVFLACALPARGAEFTETFDDVERRDTQQTSASWDVSTGMLTLARARGQSASFLLQQRPVLSLPDTAYFEAASTGDVDGDGNLDLLVTYTVYVNDGQQGSLSFVAKQAITPPDGNAFPVLPDNALADLDGDGDLDLVTASPMYVFLNNGGPTPFAGVVAYRPALGDAATLNSQGSEVRLVNLTRDGSPDLIAAFDDGTIRVLLNDGTARPFEVDNGDPGLLTVLAVRPNHAFLQQVSPLFEVADFDGDGLHDLVFLPRGNNVPVLFSNTGLHPAFDEATKVQIDVGGLPSTSLDVADMNGDGLVDLVFSDFVGSVTIYLNDGEPVPFLAPGPLPGPLRIQYDIPVGTVVTDLRLADLDGDGDVDALVANEAGANLLFVNDGSPTPFGPPPVAQFTPLSGDESNTESLEFADLDGDGDLDVVFAARDSGGRAQIVSNDFDERPFANVSPEVIATLALGASEGSMATGDVDGNGTVDAVLGGIELVVFSNGATPALIPVPTTIPARAYRAVALADFDGDGQLELVVGSATALHYFDDAGSGGDPFSGGELYQFAQTGPTSGLKQLAVGDVDGDGLLDIAYTDSFGVAPPGLLLNAGGDRPFEGAAALRIGALDSAAVFRNGLALADFNGDGRLDLLLGASSSFEVYANDGSVDPFGNAVPTTVQSGAVLSGPVAVGDIDGDGALDVVIGSINGQFGGVYAFRNLDSGQAWESLGADAGAGPLRGVALLDTDRDGDLDLIVSGRGTRPKLYRNRGRPDFLDFASPVSMSPDTHQTLAQGVADFNGDGAPDVLTSNRSGKLRLFRNDLTSGMFPGFGEAPTTVGPAVGALSDVVLTDLDGDGVLDALIASEGNGLGVRRVFSEGQEPLLTGTGEELFSADLPVTSVAVGDVNGDGRPDVVAGVAGQVNRVFLTPPAGFDGPPAIMLVDDDDNTPDVRQSYTGALDAIGARYEVWDVASQGEPTFSDVEPFEAVIWFSGRDVRGNGAVPVVGPVGAGPSDVAEDALAAYLDGGGCLLVSSQEYHYDRRLTTFMQSYLGVASVADDTVTASAVLTGAAGAFGTIGPATLSNVPFQLFADFLTPNADGAVAIRSAGGEAVGLEKSGGDHQSAYWAFGVESLSPVAQREIALAAVAGFCGVGIAGVPIGASVGTDADDTRDVMLADMNGDGKLDLVVANFGAPSRVYLNDGSNRPFHAGPVIIDLGASDNTHSLAVADIDRDGAPDIAVANDDGAIKLYFSSGGLVPAFTPVNLDDTPHAARVVRLGDLDGDGDVDVVLGRDAAATLIYVNGGAGTFPSVGVAVDGTLAEATRDIALVDVDRDGDLDIVEANDGAPQRIALNVAGAFSASGAGIAIEPPGLPLAARAVTVGDVDRNGTPDLLFAAASAQLFLQRAFDTSRGVATSLEVDDTTLIAAATLSATGSDLGAGATGSRWYLSNDGGARWHQVRLGEEFLFPSLGDDLRWRVELSSLSPRLSPSIESVTVTVARDQDEDGVIDRDDNCPLVANADQADFDLDGVPGEMADPNAGGDACDLDDDNDGSADAFDGEPFNAAVQNVAPSLTGSPPLQATPGVPFAFNPVATDSAYETLTYSLTFTGGSRGGVALAAGDGSDLPTWLSFNASTGALVGAAPTEGDFGSVEGIVITVVDRSDVQAPLSVSLAPFTLSVRDTQAPQSTAFPLAGVYPAPQQVTLTCVDGAGSGCAATHFTIDGSTPTLASAVFTAPLTVAVSTTVKFFSVDVSGNAESTTVHARRYDIDAVPPTIAVQTPLTGALLTGIGLVSGTAGDVGTGVRLVEVSISDGTNSLLSNAGTLSVGPPPNGEAQFVVARATGTDFSSWDLDVSALNFPSGNYTVIARATDGAGSVVSDLRMVELFIGTPAATSLSVALTAPSVKFGGQVDATVKLTKLGFADAPLSGSAVTLRVVDPSGDERVALPLLTNAAGQVTVSNLGVGTRVTLDEEGAWSIRAQFAGTLKLSESTAAASLLVGTSAGYVVIVQGKFPGGEGLASHNKTANRVYRTFRARGFEERNIFYYNYNPAQDANGDGVPDNAFGQETLGVDGVPDKAAILSTLVSLAGLANANPAPIYLVMVDHGGEEQFYVDPGIITPAELAGALSTLESNLSPSARARKRVVIAGACYSGSFIPALAAPGRVIIASAAANEESYKGPAESDGVRVGEYFLEELFKALEGNLDFKRAFELATARTEVFTRIADAGASNAIGNNNGFFDGAAQHPLLHDSGLASDPAANAFPADSVQGHVASGLFLGLVPPSDTNVVALVADIVAVTPTRFLPASSGAAELFLLPNFVSEVRQAFFELRAPNRVLSPRYGTEQVSVNLPRRALVAPISGNTFTLSFSSADTLFTVPGKYELFYYVEDVDAADAVTGEVRRLSPAKRSVVYRDYDGNAAPTLPVLLSPADGSPQKSVLVFDWSDASDDDAVSYTLTVARDPGLTDIVHVQEELAASGTVVLFGVLEDQTSYYWRASAIDGFGARSESAVFRFDVNNQNAIPSVIQGIVRGVQTQAAAAGVAGVSGATVSAQGAFAVSQGDGRYWLVTGAGQNVIVTASSAGFQTRVAESINVPVYVPGPGINPPELNFRLDPDLSAGRADLVVSVTDSPDPVADFTYRYTATVSNAGPDAATGVTLTVQLPGTGVLTLVPSECTLTGQTLTCELGTLANGASATVLLDIMPTQLTTYSATFTVGAAQNDPLTSNNERTETTRIDQVFGGVPGDGDGDGVADEDDNCPAIANASQTNLDNDDVGDACDDDLDGDGIPNVYERANDLLEGDAADAALDRDGDGVSNRGEYRYGSRANDATSVPSTVNLVLVPGLNIIGMPGFSGPVRVSAFEFLADIGGPSVIASIQRFNRVVGRFEAASYEGTTLTGADFMLEPGQGYSVYMLQAQHGFSP